MKNNMTKKELAESLNVSIMTIDRHMKKGLPYKKIGRSVRFDSIPVICWYECGMPEKSKEIKTLENVNSVYEVLNELDYKKVDIKIQNFVEGEKLASELNFSFPAFHWNLSDDYVFSIIFRESEVVIKLSDFELDVKYTDEEARFEFYNDNLKFDIKMFN